MPRLVLVALVVAALSLLGAILAYGLHKSSSLKNPQQTFSGLAPKSMRGPAPQFSGPTITGGHVSLAQFHGRPLIVTFFASWCPPCKQDAPRIAALARKYGSRIQIVGIDGGDTKTGAHKFLAHYGWRFPILWDPDNNQYVPFGVAAQPTTFVIDSQGKLVERFLGPIDTAVAQRVISRLLAT
ncbi:MAG: TlpA family protein disulfide reductase [Gaiellales bacterium]